MILYGAGGHAKVVYDCLISQGIRLEGVFDDNPAKEIFVGLKVINPYVPNLFVNEKLIISIGSNKIRYELSRSLKHKFGTAIHKSAFIAERSKIGLGAMIFAKSVIQTEVQFGNHVIINTGAIVDHDCVIEDFAHIGPGAVICGEVKIGTGAFIGANATVLPELSIGKWAVIGAGSVVLEDVEDGAKVAGNPAKVISV